jgi:hypothetical protein
MPYLGEAAMVDMITLLMAITQAQQETLELVEGKTGIRADPRIIIFYLQCNRIEIRISL